MNDKDTSLIAIKAQVLAFAQERDWEQFHSPKNLTMALATEAAELMEPMLWMRSEDSHLDLLSNKVRAKIEEELADVFIYAIELANVTGLDIAAIIETKMKRNAEKYPVDKAKGKSDKYTEL
jgi:NTP pyrophosphatase (non-canonical NTP hydrolase)